ncbi:hypothetical protein C2S52_014666 [Perilla frutescens var. hirtella]|nr:hypothetical protein C2S52_014666 [Perilla frutescens var. hirtella]
MASKMMIPVACALVVLFAGYGTEAIIGVNWGRESAQRLLPSQVVDLLMQNGVEHARVFTAQNDILAAFAGSGINLAISLFNPGQIKSIQDARAWVDQKRELFIASNVSTIYLGDYIFTKNNDKAFIASAMNTLRLLQTALNERRLGQQVKANFIHFALALQPNKTKPSEAEFFDELKEPMIEFLQYLKENDAPFVIQQVPAIEYQDFPDFDISFAFPDGKSNRIIKDINGLVYTNVVEWKIDSFVWAISKLNVSDNIKIVNGQIGWPTDGIDGANVTNAERFWKHLLPWAASNKGTPLRPGVPVDTYVHALTDETKMFLPMTRHWGVYRSNGEPKYKIDLTGQGRDIYPVTAKGIMHMPHRWCLFNGDRSDMEKVNRLFEWACSHSDCSSLAPGGSCSDLTTAQNVSYAFNMYFQFQFQAEWACDFDGLASLSVEDPSMGYCDFPIEVVRGRQDNYVSPSLAMKMMNGVRPRPNYLASFVFWVWVSVMLFFM